MKGLDRNEDSFLRCRACLKSMLDLDARDRCWKSMPEVDAYNA